MNLEEMMAVLEKINHFDPRRVVNEDAASAWWEVFAPVPFGIASEAVTRYYANDAEDGFLTPGRLLAVCQEIRSERAARRVRELEATRPRMIDSRPMTPVESPFSRWEHEQRKPAWQDEPPPSPIITDADRLIALEAEKQRQLAALKILMEDEQRGMDDQGGSEEGVL